MPNYTSTFRRVSVDIVQHRENGPLHQDQKLSRLAECSRSLGQVKGEAASVEHSKEWGENKIMECPLGRLGDGEWLKAGRAEYFLVL